MAQCAGYIELLRTDISEYSIDDWYYSGTSALTHLLIPDSGKEAKERRRDSRIKEYIINADFEVGCLNA